MENFKSLFFCFLLLLIIIGCNQSKKQKIPQTAENEFDSVLQDTAQAFEMAKNVVFRFPTPGEMFGVIKEGGLTFQGKLLNEKSNSEKYLGFKKQALGLGVYIADFAYIALFGKQNDAVDYLNVIEDLSQKVQVAPALNKQLIDKVKNNLGSVDSLIEFSDEAFLEMFSYCENNKMHNVNSIISAGAYIEGLYIALNSVEKYSTNNKVLDQLAQQKFSFEHLLTYANEYKADKDVLAVTEELQKISEIFSSLGYEEKKSNVSDKNKTLIIGGGKKYKFTKEQYTELKKLVNKIRSGIIEVS